MFLIEGVLKQSLLKHVSRSVRAKVNFKPDIFSAIVFFAQVYN
jgi:hypothetical protein